MVIAGCASRGLDENVLLGMVVLCFVDDRDGDGVMKMVLVMALVV